MRMRMSYRKRMGSLWLAVSLLFGGMLHTSAKPALQPSFRILPTSGSQIVSDTAGGSKGIVGGQTEPGPDGQGLYFYDGTLTIAANRLRGLLYQKGEVSICMRLRADAGGSSVPFRVQGGSGEMLRVRIDQTGLLSLYCRPGAYDNGTTVPLGEIAQERWVFVTVVLSLSGGYAALYQDGELLGRKDVRFFTTAFAETASACADELQFTKTAVGEIALYPAALSGQDMQAAMQLPAEKSDETPLQPVSAWSFDRVEGQTVKADGTAPADGILHDCNLITEGVTGRAVSVPGERMGYMDIGKSVSETLVGSSAISVSFWMRSKAPAGWGRLIALYSTNEKAMLHISYNGGGAYDRRMILTIGGRSCPTESYKSRDFNLYDIGEGADWIHVTAVLDFAGKQITAYLNGKQAEPYHWNNNPVDASIKFEKETLEKGKTPYPDCIGGDIAIRSSYPGYLDEVAFYDRAVTAGEAHLLYLAGASDAVSKLTLEREQIPVIQGFGKNAAAFYPGVGFAIYDGGRVWFRDDDHTEAPFYEDGNVFLPVSALTATGYRVTETAQGLRVAGKSSGVVSPEAVRQKDGVWYCAAQAAAAAAGVQYVQEGAMAVLYTGVALSDAIKTQYLWLLTDTHTQYPVRSHNKTRTVIAATDTLTTGIRFGDPSLTLLDNGHIIATYIPYDDRRGTMVYCSADGGETWKNTAFVPNVGSVTPFQVDGTLYLMGIGERAIRVLKSDDEGYTWTEPADEQTGLFARAEIPYPHAISPVLFANGRIYRAFEEQTDENGKNQWVTTYRSFMVSAPLDCDLLDMRNWTFTNLVDYDFVGKGYSTYTDHQTYNYTGGWLEGNAIATPEGKVYNMLRLQTGNESGYAALCSLSADNRTLSFDPESGIVHFEGGMSKFLTRYDEQSGYYVSIANIVTDKSNSNQRNVLGMNISKDLYTWETAEILLCDETLMPWYDSVYHHAFQYVDWVFDGDDIIMVVREAADQTKAYHEANRVTFYRVKEFRKYFNQ